jgi:hypothetical protein
MAAQVGERVGVDAVRVREHGKVVAEAPAFAGPAADAEIRVVALREQPAVTASRRAELHDCGPA